MKKLTLASAFLFFFSSLFASHNMGLDISYVCTGPNTYEVTVSYYRDCSGIPAPGSLNLDFSNGCGLTNPTSIAMAQEPCPGSLVPGGTACEVTNICASSIGTTCCNSTSPGCLQGVERFIYKASFTLPVGCASWKISVDDCCRNGAITNVNGGAIYVESLINDTITSCNNAPAYIDMPIFYTCVDVYMEQNFGGIDPDGDSLVYRMIAPKTNASGTVTYMGGYSVTTPFSSSTPINLDINTGVLTATPDMVQVAVIAVEVTEYRNGVAVGSAIRDIQIVVLPSSQCNSGGSSIPVFQGIQNLTGGSLSGRTINACPDSIICFNIAVNDTAGLQLVAELQAANLDSVSISYIDSVDSLWITIKVLPNIDDTLGTRSLTIKATNDGCPVFQSSYWSVNFKIKEEFCCATPISASINEDDTTICSPSLLNLSSSVSGLLGNPQYSWQTQLGASLGTGSTASGTFNGGEVVTLTVVDDSTNCKNTDKIFITAFDAGITSSGDSICSGDSILFNSFNNTPNHSLSYTWTWNNGLSTSTGSTLNTSFSSNDVVSLQVSNNTLGCILLDNATVGIYPPLTLTYSGDTTACFGDTINITAILTGGIQPYQVVVDSLVDTVMPSWSNTVITSFIIVETVSTTQSFTIEVIDANGCRLDHPVTLSLNGAGCPVVPNSISNFNDDKISMYPNPSNGIVYLESTELMDSYELINGIGQTVLSKRIDSKTVEIDMSEMSKGSYLMRIKSNSKVLNKSLILK